MAQAIYELEPIGEHGADEATRIHWYCNGECASRASVDGPTSSSENDDAEEGAICEACGKYIDTTVSLADVMAAPHAYLSGLFR